MDWTRRTQQIREAAPSQDEEWCVQLGGGLLYGFHRSSKLLLDFVRQQAYGEARKKVAPTVGTQLPVVLTEQVFEWALRAQQLPLVMQAKARPHNALDEHGTKACKVLPAWSYNGRQLSGCGSCNRVSDVLSRNDCLANRSAGSNVDGSRTRADRVPRPLTLCNSHERSITSMLLRAV